MPKNKISPKVGKSGIKPVSVESPKPVGQANSLKHAAALTGFSTEILQRIRNSAPQFFDDHGRIDCDGIMGYLAENPSLTDGPGMMTLPAARTLEILASWTGKLIRNKERARELIPVEEVKRAAARNNIACKKKLYDSNNAIAVEAAMKLGLTPEQMNRLREIIADSHNVSIRELRKGEWGEPECPNCGKKIAA